VTDWLLIALLGGLAAADTTAFLQGMFYQPLVICTLVGSALGLPLEGAFYGALLQLLWLGELPVGGTYLPDIGVAAAGLSGGALLMLKAGTVDLGLSAAMVALLAVPVAWAGGRLVHAQRESQAILARWAGIFTESGRPTRIRMLLAVGVLFAVLRGVVLALASAGLTYLLLHLIGGPALEGRISPFTLLAGLLGVGLGVLFGVFDDDEVLIWAGGGVVVTTVVLLVV
jgi:PTS system mannose-specific IIC component